MKCPSCGHEAPDGSNFCPACGQPLKQATHQKPPAHMSNAQDLTQVLPRGAQSNDMPHVGASRDEAASADEREPGATMPDTTSPENAFENDGEQVPAKAQEAAEASRAPEADKTVVMGSLASDDATNADAGSDEIGAAGAGGDAVAPEVRSAAGSESAAKPRILAPKPVPRYSETDRIARVATARRLPSDRKSSRQAILMAASVFAIGAIVLIGISTMMRISGTGQVPVTPPDSQSATEAATEAASASATSPSLEAKNDPSGYTWAELALIAQKIEGEASSRSQALEIAKKFNLVDDSSQLTQATWSVQMSDGTTAQVRLADIYHDELSNSSGYAGLTFLSASPVTTHKINATNTNTGGWKSSELRSYLNSSEFEATLPSEISAAAVSVKKSTNNTGRTTDASDVTQTADTYWIPSVVELVGEVSWTWASHASESPLYNAVLNAEGSQYAWAEQANIRSANNEQLATGTTCHLRSSSCSVADHFREVDAQGDPTAFGDADADYGILLGFCF